jgi:hypothetical protein
MAKLINDALALQSFRHSDFDVYSAYGEVVDNSIQANAAWVKLRIDSCVKDQRGRTYHSINAVVFSDNGIGMDKKILSNCLGMGYSSRYGDRSGIGRFGVGMTLASINQCKHVEVYSREDKGKWLWTYADLDEISAGKMTDIPEAIEKDLPEKYRDMASDGSGTIVIWSKYDRQPESADKIENELFIWLGRTYRHFIWDGLQIFVNEREVFAIDPLYAKTDKTKNPALPKAELFEPIEFKWSTMKEFDDDPNLSIKAPIKIYMSILPEEFRKHQGVGGSNEARDLYIDRNEGVSIVRNKREVFYGEIPYYKPAFKEIDRWWGCEILFNAELDTAFTVKNIKRGAVPTAELRSEIERLIEPTRKTVTGKVQDFWKDQKVKDRSSPEDDNGHGEAEQVAGNTPTPQNRIDRNKIPEVEVKKAAVGYAGNDHVEQERLERKMLQNILSIEEKSWSGLDFFQTTHLGGRDLLAYNQRHMFFEKLNSIMDEILKYYPDSKLHQHLKTLIDLLLVSYSKSEAMLEPGKQMKSESFIENIKADWGRFLKQYLETWETQSDDFILEADEQE